METYSLPVWLVRRIGGEVKYNLELVSEELSLKDVVKDPKLLLPKVAIGYVISLLPDRPNASQIEGLSPKAGQWLDLLDEYAFRRDPKLATKKYLLELGRRLLVGESPGGFVFVLPSFYGVDP